MRHFGLTGNIGSGKSSVAILFRGLGATVIDADVLAREAVAPGTDGYAKVVAHFGSGILSADGTIDRAALRRLVFSDPVERDVLNGIVHPAVAHLRELRLAECRARNDDVVLSDVPLLFEVGLEHAFDGVILVDAPEPLRLTRLMRDRGLPAEEAQAMIDAQMPSEKKRAIATWVVDNVGSREQLAVAVADLWYTLQTTAEPGPSIPSE